MFDNKVDVDINWLNWSEKEEENLHLKSHSWSAFLILISDPLGMDSWEKHKGTLEHSFGQIEFWFGGKKKWGPAGA